MRNLRIRSDACLQVKGIGQVFGLVAMTLQSELFYTYFESPEDACTACLLCLQGLFMFYVLAFKGPSCLTARTMTNTDETSAPEASSMSHHGWAGLNVNGLPRFDPIYCSICKMDVNGQAKMDDHLIGRKHRKCLERQGRLHGGGGKQRQLDADASTEQWPVRSVQQQPKDSAQKRTG